MTSKTTKWHVSLKWEAGGPVVLVSKKPISGRDIVFRTISANAAARRYIRNNLARDIAAADWETDNPFSMYEIEDWMVKSRGHYRKLAKIRVLKD